jgi:hypothetical protein
MLYILVIVLHTWLYIVTHRVIQVDMSFQKAIVFLFIAINGATGFMVSKPKLQKLSGQQYYCIINSISFITSTAGDMSNTLAQRPFLEELLLAVLPGFVPTVLPLAVGVYLLNSNKETCDRAIASNKEAIASNKEAIASNKETCDRAIASNKDLILLSKELNEKSIAHSKELNTIILNDIKKTFEDTLREMRDSKTPPPEL